MRITFFAGTLIIILLAGSCRRNPQEVPVDPCKDRTSFKAAFTIEEKVGDTSYVTDKALAPGYVFFKAKGAYDSIRWYIGGTQNTSTNTNHVLYFQNPEGPVDVTFIGYKKPDINCFPNDKATDTMRQTITILPRDNKAGIVGRFLGYNESNPADTFTVEISYVIYNGFGSYYVKNLPKGCPGYTAGNIERPNDVGLEIAAGYSGFRVNEGSKMCATVTGYGFLRGKDSIKINYSAMPVSGQPFVPGGPRADYRFIGVRKL